MDLQLMKIIFILQMVAIIQQIEKLMFIHLTGTLEKELQLVLVQTDFILMINLAKFFNIV